MPFLSLIAADVCFIMYRRICVSTSHKLSNKQLKQVVMVGREAVQAAEELLSKRQMWWNMLSTLFQFCCILISIDTTDSLAHLQGTMMVSNARQVEGMSSPSETLERQHVVSLGRHQLSYAGGDSILPTPSIPFHSAANPFVLRS